MVVKYDSQVTKRWLQLSKEGFSLSLLMFLFHPSTMFFYMFVTPPITDRRAIYQRWSSLSLNVFSYTVHRRQGREKTPYTRSSDCLYTTAVLYDGAVTNEAVKKPPHFLVAVFFHVPCRGTLLKRKRNSNNTTARLLLLCRHPSDSWL